MKIIKVAFWQCLFLLQFANTADLELTTNENIKDFIVRFLEEEIENRTSFMNSFSETKISVEFFNDFKKHIDEIAVKSIRDYIDGKPRDKKNYLRFGLKMFHMWNKAKPFLKKISSLNIGIKF